ncbi:DMT family transporter [uncultured Mycolicibacterium sp.]|uniref:DMT family transporter n=1 Tax=uncultured Mycolicibacterium sp. TaxID=2320817 RepID=UPI00261F5337|nr:DMT family transporter [uncultured Mycolicibacterium sp.]
MVKADLAVLLALAAALFTALGNVVQERSVQRVAPAGGRAGVLAGLLRDRRWWVGTAAGLAGFALQAAALSLGSVLLVQALLVTSLLFALPMQARLTGRPVGRGRLAWAAVLATAETYALLAVAGAAVVLQQYSFRAGPLTAALPGAAIAEPLVAAVLGIVVLGESLHPGDAGWAVLVAAVAALVTATVALTRGEAADAGPDRAPVSVNAC